MTALSPQEKQLILDGHKQGKTMYRIWADTGIPRESIRRFLRDEGLNENKK